MYLYGLWPHRQHKFWVRIPNIPLNLKQNIEHIFLQYEMVTKIVQEVWAKSFTIALKYLKGVWHNKAPKIQVYLNWRGGVGELYPK